VAFDPIHFETTLVDIERYLGYLRGNEVAWDYLQQYPVDFEGELPPDGEGVTIGPVWLDQGYRFPCPDGQYAVEPDSPVLGWVPTGPGVSAAEFVKQVQANLDQAWANGQAWATGVADYARSVCDQFTQVEVPSLSADIRQFQQSVVDPLQDDQANDEWAKLGDVYSTWNGAHKTAFVIFYNNYNDIEARWGRYLGAVTTGFASFAGLAGATQLGVQKFADTLLAGIKEQLGSWVGHRGEPGSAAKTPAWVADIPAVLKVVQDLASYVPAASGPIKVVKTATQVYGLLDKFAGEGSIKQLKEVPVRTADEIYTTLSQSLQTDYLTAYQDALDALNSGGSGAVDGNNDEAEMFSAAGLLHSMQTGDGVVPDPVDPGSLAGPGGHY
jgi:hypothetical protein